MINITSLLIATHATLKEALAQLDVTAQGVLLVTDSQGKLMRTVTDGDIRRLLLEGIELSETLSVLPSHQSKCLPETSSASDAYQIMQQYELDHIPVIDSQGKPVKLIHRREISPSILLSTPHLGELEQQYVQEAFDSNWIAPLGPNVDAFEQELAQTVNIPAAAALSSGTAAIHLALVLLGIKPGDSVFCSSFTFVASANPILYQGATPVFIDSDLATWNMSPRALQSALLAADKANRLPKAVIVVNLYGQSADFEPIKALCQHYQIPIIEDAAESLGATYKGQASGTLGDIGIYSFNGNKIITTSGGGMLVSADTALVEKARFLAQQARDPAPHYEHSHVGYNYRMSNVLAGIGRGQLQVLEQRVQSRQAIFNLYQSSLSQFPELEMMPEAEFGRSTHWLSTMLLHPEKTGLRPSQFIQALSQHAIEARHTWKPLHRQRLFQGCEYYPHQEDFSVSDYLFENGVCLPSGSNMKPIDIQRIIETISTMMQTQQVCYA